ncbi:OmpA family protein [Vibrio sp. Y2-5]|uniref:OmpA family protein n=1 Tax=Vibrio TaxID=662 RepID=UPI00142D2D8B|nr:MULTISPECIES: OmpA family protein [Vibrio]MBD0784954.1 OmpA family protein [Vibrio sp. Y2-5]NIY92071.1 OmpA family protein [Vibrio diazotrophicus]
MKKLAVLISMSLAVGSTAALAEVYVGGKIGTSWLDDACLAGDVCDDDGGVTLGGYLGYQAYDWLSFELGYDYLGKFSGTGLDDDSVTAITLAPRFSLPLNDDVALYLKAGGAYAEYGSKDDFSYLGAAGVELKPLDQVSIRLEYQAITDINNDYIRAQANTITLGFTYKFGHSKTTEAAPVAVVEEPMVEEVVEQPAEPKVVKKSFTAKSLDGHSFAHDSSELTEEANNQLDNLIEFMKEYPESNVEISGYTDSSGSAAYNQTLSEKRAQAAADAIIAKGIDESRITVKGEGEENPIASNQTPEGREKNRRVEFYIPEFEHQVSE